MNNQYYSPGSFRVLPPVVKNLLILNGLFFLATISLDKAFNYNLIDLFGLHYFAASKFQPFQFITYMFMHGGWAHIFFNMFALWMFGNVLENYWGPKRFIIYYLVTGIGAALTHYLLMYYYDLAPVLNRVNAFLANPSLKDFNEFAESDYFRIISYDLQARANSFISEYNSLVMSDPARALQSAVDFMHEYKTEFLNAPVVVGASGAVFGILLAFGMTFPNSLIYLYFAIPIKAKWFVLIYGALELYAGITKSGSNVAHFAHLGGMVFGLVLILFWRKRRTFY